MSSRSAVTIGVALFVVSACGGGSRSPLAPESPATPSGTLQGQTTSATDATAFAGVSVRLGTQQPTTSDANGYFTLENSAGSGAIELTGASIVDRKTDVRLPSNGVVKFGLIPTSFDLVAFNEMFRGSHDRLQRWTDAPPLVVLTDVMRFETSESTSAEATDEQIPAGEVDVMVRDLTDALATLTGNAYTAFAQVTRESTAAGSRVSTARNGVIVVGRYRDLKTKSNIVGYGRWAEREDGVITGGAVFLDSIYDAGRDRKLLRTHELGHALGYKHVTSRPSIMNPVLGYDVTDFDRQGAAIAFQRPPGNHAPDTDPAPSLRSMESASIRWTSEIP